MSSKFSSNRSNSALNRVIDRLRPRNVAETVASSFERSPIAFTFVAILAPSVAYISALGVRGALGAPMALALLLGALGVYTQCALFSMIRSGTGPLVRLLGFLLAVSAWNAISLAAGIVAANPDQMGRALIERQLAITVNGATAKASTLERLAGQWDSLAVYSNDTSKLESIPSVEKGWQPTCPRSTGPGPGTITEWRRATGIDANSRATIMRTAAVAARQAASSAELLSRSYTLADHNSIMRKLGAAVSAIGAASSSADRDGMDAMLDRLAAETAANGMCPDATLQALIAGVRSVPLVTLDHQPQFTPLPRPSEAEAVGDLWSQLQQGLNGDYSLYGFALLISPAIDIFMMTMLGLILSHPRPEGDDIAIAEAIGIDPEEADLLDDAFNVAANDPDWTELVAKTESIGGRWLRVKRIRLDADDWANVHWMRHLAELGQVRDAGMVDGQHIFVLRPRFLFRRFNQIVRKHISASRAQAIPNLRQQPEMQR